LLQAFGGSCLPDVNAGDGQQADNWNVDTTSWSLFTHDEIAFGPRMTLTVGARYTNEDKDMHALLNSTNAACGSLQGANRPFALAAAGFNPASNVLFALACNAVTNTLANGSFRDSRSEDNVSGTASLSYHVTDDFMLYATYARGYKAGGFNLDRSAF